MDLDERHLGTRPDTIQRQAIDFVTLRVDEIATLGNTHVLQGAAVIIARVAIDLTETSSATLCLNIAKILGTGVMASESTNDQATPFARTNIIFIFRAEGNRSRRCSHRHNFSASVYLKDCRSQERAIGCG